MFFLAWAIEQTPAAFTGPWPRLSDRSVSYRLPLLAMCCQNPSVGTGETKRHTGRNLAILGAAAAVCTILALIFDVFSYVVPSPPTPPAAAVATAEPEMTTPEQQGTSPTPKPSPSASTSTPGSSPTAAVAAAPPIDTVTITTARIEIKGLERHHLGVDLYDVEAQPDYETFVYTAAGRIEGDDCYVAWTVYNNNELKDQARTGCAKSPGWGGPYWPDVDYQPGSVLVTADITTDAGASFHTEVPFQMIEN